MELALIVSALVALLLGGTFGAVSTSMTKPMSDSFQLYGVVWPTLAGLIFGTLAFFFAAAPLWAILANGAVGLIVSFLAVAGVRMYKGR